MALTDLLQARYVSCHATNSIKALKEYNYTKRTQNRTTRRNRMLLTRCCSIWRCMLLIARLTGCRPLRLCSTPFNHDIISFSRSFSCFASSHAAVSRFPCSMYLSFTAFHRAETSSSDCRSCAVTALGALFAILSSPISSNELIFESRLSLDSNISWETNEPTADLHYIDCANS